MHKAIMHPMERRRLTLRIKTWVGNFPVEHVIEREGDQSAFEMIKREGADYLEREWKLAEARNAEFQYRLDLTQEAL